MTKDPLELELLTVIPYFTIPPLQLGPFSISPYGVLLMSGILLGNWRVRRRARESAIDVAEMQTAVIWAVAGGFVGAHIVELFFYQPNLIERDGLLVIFNIWKGLSSFGGFIGGLISFYIYFRRRNQPCLIQAALVLEGLVVGWVFGRLGCTFAHDHMGQQSSFFLAFNYPAGPRHNLGFYEFLLALLVLLPITLITRRAKFRPAVYLALIPLIYGSVRFWLDFLRATDLPAADLRYFGLTAAQYGCLALVTFGIWTLVRVSRSRIDEPFRSISDRRLARG